MRTKASKSVLITGGTGSVGRALVHAFATAGYAVTFQYNTNTTRANRLIKRYAASALQIDLTQRVDLDHRSFGVIINNAAINDSEEATARVSLGHWNDALRVNLSAPFEIISQCLPAMVKWRWGRIINISSIYGLRAVEERLPYTVSKHGLSALTKTVAKEYGRYGITSNEICPGPIESEMMQNIAERANGRSRRGVRAYFREIESEIPTGRLADPNDIAALALFIASPQASHLNGTSLPLDGGYIA